MFTGSLDMAQFLRHLVILDLSGGSGVERRTLLPRRSKSPVQDPAAAAKRTSVGPSRRSRTTLDGPLAQLAAPARTLQDIRCDARLAERAGQDHSVVVFEVQDPRIDAGPAQQLVHAARRAMLDGDEIGWLGATRIAVSLPLTDSAVAAVRAERIARECRSSCTVYSQIGRPGALGSVKPDVTLRPLAELLSDPLPRWKRVVDVIGALVLLVLTAPVLLLAAVLVRLSSPGPAIFRQQRAGLHGVPFVLYKFRTMIDGAEAMKQVLLKYNEVAGACFKMKNDPRVTKVGRFLRVTSLDELPQLWNVLRGDMSLVGPRPPTLDEVSCYRAWHNRRLTVLPGITGLWQVSDRACPDFDARVRMDLRYIEQRSPLGDLRLLGSTVPTVLSRRGAV